jgi:hypothetical protein
LLGPPPELFHTKMRMHIDACLQIGGKTVAMGMAVRRAITTKPSRGFKQESATDDCCVDNRRHGEVTSKGQGRKAPREALQWRGDGGCAIVMRKLLDQFRQSCGGTLSEIAGSGERNSPASLSYVKQHRGTSEIVERRFPTQNSRAFLHALPRRTLKEAPG